MKRLFRLLTVLALVAGGICLLVFAWLQTTTVTAADLPDLKNGDIVFQDAGSRQGLAIMLASRSLYTHVGLIEIDAAGIPLVIEAAAHVQTVPLARWIKNGRAGRITIKRIKALSDSDARSAIARAHVYDGRPYDFFYEGRDEIYCSELIYAAYKEGPGISVGQLEKVGELHIDNFAVRSLIETRWQRYPLCQAKDVATFDACYKIILEQKLVTPASIARDSRMQLIYSNFGVLGD